MLDDLGRPLRDLRLSVTDRCDHRCTYCMPIKPQGKPYVFLPKRSYLGFEEIERLVRILIGLGLEKVKITGGEPLMRENLPELMVRLAGLPGLADLALVTNGDRLAALARPLRSAGLHRINVSLDALDDACYRRMNGVSRGVDVVLAGIDAALAAGFCPIKVNMVVIRGVNDHQIESMADHFRHPSFVLRFIEYMDVGTRNDWTPAQVVPSAEILARLQRRRPLLRIPSRHAGEVARRYAYADGSSEVGFISSVSQPFCRNCTRLRVSAAGHLFTCLFASQGADVRTWLRDHGDDRGLAARLAALWGGRRDHYSEQRSSLVSVRANSRRANSDKVEMYHVGG